MSEVGKDLIQSANEVINGETRTFVEVVRCKDCKYWDKEQTQCNYRLLTEDVHMKVMADDFCSRGERKDG